MRRFCVKISAVLAVLMVWVALFSTAACGWETEQQALNNIVQDDSNTVVLLRKLEKTADGTPTETVVPGAVFRLYRQDGELIGGPFATDQNGQIKVALPAGSYYYEETTPPAGYSYDWDGSGAAITRYPFTVTEQQRMLTVLAYNRPVQFEPLTVVLPAITKIVDGQNAPQQSFSFQLNGQSGCPMPQGAQGSTLVVSRTGAGSVELGSLSFSQPGEYRYTLRELESSDPDWIYDNVEYTLAFNVVVKDGKLFCSGCTIIQGEMPAQQVVFVNLYKSIGFVQTVTVSGQKTWKHNGNPKAERPDHIVVQVYGDGQLVQQRRVSAEENWSYSFELPKFNAAGRQIVYRIDEESVSGYRKLVSGYDLTNTFVGSAEEPDEPESGSSSGSSSGSGASSGSGSGSAAEKPPATGEEFQLAFWVAALLVSLFGFSLMVLLLAQKPEEQIARKDCKTNRPKQ